MKILSFDDNHQLRLERTSISKICNEVETPFYLYSENDILQNCESIINHGKKTGLMPCYALKANYNPSILKTIKDIGFGAEVVSGGELYFALKTGFAPEKIVFAGVGKTETAPKELVDIVGPVCETSDFLAKDRELPLLKQSDFIAVTGAGAYGQALALNYNLRPVIAEILVNNDKYKIIRQRESMKELAERFDWN